MEFLISSTDVYPMHFNQSKREHSQRKLPTQLRPEFMVLFMKFIRMIYLSGRKMNRMMRTAKTSSEKQRLMKFVSLFSNPLKKNILIRITKMSLL